MTELDYNVIATGSTGNAVRIGSIMIDCGIPFKKMKADLYKCNTLLITHAHSDHVKESTLTRIYSEFPRIETYANPDVAYRFRINHVITTKPFDVKMKRTKIHVIPMEGVHDVPVSYFILQMDDKNIIYSTDNILLENRGLKFDYLFLESNYDETLLRETAKKYRRRGYDPVESSLRHMSTQRCKEFYFVNRRSKDSVLIELHKSSRFYR